MAQTSSRSRRGKSSRMGRGLKITIGLLLALLVVMVLNAFALNNETEPASLTKPGATLVQTTSGELQVLDTGPSVDPNSMPIVLIHGSGGAINWWDEVLPPLSADNRVVAIDLLGYGGSSKPRDGYSVESQAGLVAQVLTALGIDTATVVGHSFGGKIATALAESSPELVAGVALIDMAPDSSFGGLSGGAKAAEWPLLGQALWRIAPDVLIRKNVSQGFAPGYDVPDKYVDDIKDVTYPAYSGSYSASIDFTDAEPLNDRLEKTGVPLLVIFGEEDQIYPARESLSAYAAIPGARTLLIQGSGHSPQVEAPEKTAVAIKEFANSLVPEPTPLPEPKPKPKPNKKKQQQQQNQQKQDGKNQKSGNDSKKKANQAK